MSTTQTTPQNALVPVVRAEHEKPDINQLRLEALNALEHDYGTFHIEVRRRMYEYDKALSAVTSGLYKEVFDYLVGGSKGHVPDYIINGLHGKRYNGLDQVKAGLADMHNAMYQAKSYCLALRGATTGGNTA